MRWSFAGNCPLCRQKSPHVAVIDCPPRPSGNTVAVAAARLSYLVLPVGGSIFLQTDRLMLPSIKIFRIYGNYAGWKKAFGNGCADWYASDYYRHSPRVDPQGPSTGIMRVTRGYAWALHWETWLRFSQAETWCRSRVLGFRIVCEVEQSEKKETKKSD